MFSPLFILQSHIESYTQFCLLLLASGIIIMVFDFYAESICFQVDRLLFFNFNYIMI